MDEFKINRWVEELICRGGFLGRLNFLPLSFYNQLSDSEQREVMKRYKDRTRNAAPYGEIK